VAVIAIIGAAGALVGGGDGGMAATG